jgi:beta-lactamase regulating signal transducer with metallopeptidase domain
MLDRLLSLSDSSLWFAVDVGLKATLLLAIAAAITVVLRAGSAAVRHRVWAITFAALLLLPLANGVLPGWNWRVVPRHWQPTNDTSPVPRPLATADAAASAGQTAFVPQTPQSGRVPDVESKATPGVQAPFFLPTTQKGMVPDNLAVEASNSIAAPIGSIGTPPSLSSLTWLLLVWLAGALAALLPLITGIIGNLLLRRRGRRLVDEDWQELLDALVRRLVLRRKVALLVGGPDQMPMTFGWLHPYVVLPSDAANWPRDQRQAVLLHELAHVKRCDVPLQLIARVSFALYWFHPLAWLGIRRMRLEREHACDDCVLRAGQKASSYAAQLLEIARAHRATSPLATAALSMARPSQLEGRLLAVLDPHRSRVPLSAVRGVALTLSALLLVVGLGILRPALQAESPKSISGEAALTSKDPSGHAAESNDHLTVTGTVVTSKGKPVAGALIEIVATELDDPLHNTKVNDEIPFYRLNSDSAGRFEIALPRGLFNQSLRVANNQTRVMFFASADGFSAREIMLQPKPHQRSMDVKLELPEPKTIRLHLIDSGGDPVAGVEPTLWSVAAGEQWLGLVDHRAAKLLKSWPRFSRTGGDGSCSIIIPANAASVGVLVENERFRQEILHFKTADEPIAVALKPSRHLNGKVVAADSGAPIEGVEVRTLEEPYLRAQTDKNGSFRIARGSSLNGLPINDTRIYLYSPPDSPYLSQLVAWEWPNDGIADAQLTIKMENGVIAEGDVAEKESGRPVAGASIYFEQQQYNNKFYRRSSAGRLVGSDMPYRTDSKGHFRLPVSPGPGYLFVTAPTPDFVHVMVSDGEKDYGKPGLTREYYDGVAHLNLKLNEKPAPLRIELQRGITLRRRVVRPDGQPAEGAAYTRSYVRDQHRIVNGWPPERPVENGVLELPGFEPEHSNPMFIIDVEHHCATVVSPTASETELSNPPIQLGPTGSARFRFLNDKGEGLSNYDPHLELIVTPGAPATLFNERPNQPLWADAIRWTNIRYWHFHDKPPKTDAEGRVVMPDLIPGATYRLSFIGKKPGSDDGYEFTVRPGETTNVGDVTIPTHD